MMGISMDRRILITGGSGFIGTNLVGYYLSQGWEVCNFDIVQPRNQEYSRCWIRLNLLDRKQVIQETQQFRPTVLFHFGARTDLKEQKNLGGYAANIEGVCNVIDAIRSTPSICRAIFASSQLVCRIGYKPVNNEDYCPSTLYGQSKVLTERIINTAHEFGPTWTIVRPTSLWGPWFDVPYRNFFETIVRNLYVHPGGVRTFKQWGFIGNTVHQLDQILQASENAVHRKTFYLADYQPIELREFADLIQRAAGARPIPTIPSELMKAAAFGGDILQKIGWKNPPLTRFRYTNITTDEVQDLEPLKAVVGPLPYTIEQGIELTVRWLRQHWNN